MEKKRTDYLDEARATWNKLTPEARRVLAYWLNITYAGTLCKQRIEKGFCRREKDENTFTDSDSDFFRLVGIENNEMGNKADSKKV